jgi:hypothetical protein
MWFFDRYLKLLLLPYIPSANIPLPRLPPAEEEGHQLKIHPFGLQRKKLINRIDL